MKLEAWIDVGGTFTDCLVRTHTGEVLRTKTLSSSRVPVTVTVKTTSRTECHCPELESDCPGFWNGAFLAGFDAEGTQMFQQDIQDASCGDLQFNQPIDWATASYFEVRPNCEAPVLAVHRLLQNPLSKSLPPLIIRLGTTRGTNALLTRTGAKVALLVTDPFEDLLTIGDQTRPDLFALEIVKPTQLSQRTYSIVERLDAQGKILLSLDSSRAKSQLTQAKLDGCTSVAISLLHSYLNPIHELQLESIAKECGFEHVSVSHRLASVVEYVARTQTTVLDAYLSPIIRRYFSSLCEQFGGSANVELLVMTSAGGLIDWRDYSGKDCILSGPAGGVVALSCIRQELQQPIIGLDMGGTSTDVSRAGETLELQYESNKAGVRVLAPTLPIETVAAGGGSICWFDGVSLRVGPQSAGAFPGPACYGRGGPLTITDLNVSSGRVPESQFPFPLDIRASWIRIDQLLSEIAPVLGSWTRNRLIDGLRRLANEQMAEAVRTVSIKQGVDPRQHALVGFGGAAGQHICEIADALGIHNIIDHPDAGLLSAVGMGLAQRRLDSVIPVYAMLDQIDWNSLRDQAGLVGNDLGKKLGEGHNKRSEVSAATNQDADLKCQIELRYQGTDSTLTIPFWTEGQLSNTASNAVAEEITSTIQAEFTKLHLRRFGYERPGRSIELVTVRVSVQEIELRKLESINRGSIQRQSSSPTTSSGSFDNLTNQVAGESYDSRDRADIQTDQLLKGPLIVLNAGSTLVIERGWQAILNPQGLLTLERFMTQDPRRSQDSLSEEQFSFDPVLRDCYAQRLSAIATQMGHVLQQTAVSVNVKQRRDYSCAVFDGSGQLLANAPHVPVHLGAMGATVRAILDRFPAMQAGDAYLCNDPYSGGSHLPDLTLVQPVFDKRSPEPSFFVANRAHHADIGGVAPGSMSIDACRLEQEGIVIPPIQIAQANHLVLEELEQLVRCSPFPPRKWEENLADIYAQRAACLRGCELLSEYAATIGWKEMRRYSQHLLEASQARIEHFFANELFERTNLKQNSRAEFSDQLEDGTPICVAISISPSKRLMIDFEGTGSESTTNLNANPSIVSAAVLYVLRCLVADDLPLNEGVLRAVELRIPRSVLNPQVAEPRGQSPAVAAGNVETSQRVVDVLLGALGIAAASQGTMNNLLFGNESFGFYETICGGSGATKSASGASAVHTHMTNTRLTDPEVLELRYPVRLVQFGVRKGSGGHGKHNGGDGVVRSFEFLQPVSLSLLTSRRGQGPFGLVGGKPGACGENWLLSPKKQLTKLPSSCQLSVEAGSILTILTPGGGGFGFNFEL